MLLALWDAAQNSSLLILVGWMGLVHHLEVADDVAAVAAAADSENKFGFAEAG